MTCTTVVVRWHRNETW